MKSALAFTFFLCVITIGQVHAQSNESIGNHWKDLPTIQSRISEELQLTIDLLNQNNLTDWSEAMGTAYKSFLEYAQEEISKKQELGQAFDTAFDLMSQENFGENMRRYREMVLDDMKQKKQEFIQTITNH